MKKENKNSIAKSAWIDLASSADNLAKSGTNLEKKVSGMAKHDLNKSYKHNEVLINDNVKKMNEKLK